MKTASILLAMVTMSCSGVSQYVCVTKCGIHLDSRVPGSVSDGWSCDAMQKYEDDFIEEFARRVTAKDAVGVREPMSKENLCSTIGRLRGVAVYVQQNESWYSSSAGGIDVAGLTQCDYSVIQVGLAKTPYSSSMSHELSHWIQGCYSDSRAVAARDSEYKKQLESCLSSSATKDALASVVSMSACYEKYNEQKSGLGQVGYHSNWETNGIYETEEILKSKEKK